MVSELTFKHVDSTEEIRSRFDREAGKLQKRLIHFQEDSVQLRGVVESRIGKDLFSWSLNLRLPGKTLHTSNESYKLHESMDEAFDDIETQLEKYLTQLRREQYWKKGRAQTIKTPPEPEMPSDEEELEELEFVENAESEWK